MDPKEEPTEELAPLEGTPLVPEDAVEEESDFTIPATRAELTEEEDEGEEEVEEEVTPEPVVEEELPKVEEPADFTPPDDSFEVTVYDKEGANAKTIKVGSVEQWDKLLEDEANFGSASALMRASRKATRMELNLESAKREYDKEKKEFEDSQAVTQEREEALNNLANELNYLTERGDLPKISQEYKDANWEDPEVAKQPGVKEQLALLTYMHTENNKRIKAGLKPMTSVIDAFNGYRLDEKVRTDVEVRKQSAERRKAAGGRVASSSPQPVSVAPKGVMVGRAISLDEL